LINKILVIQGDPIDLICQQWTNRRKVTIMKKWGDLQLGFWQFAAQHISIGVSAIGQVALSCNGCNSPYVKLYTYATCVIQLHQYQNNYCVTLMRLVYNCHGNVMLFVIFHQSIKI
jgi:hypothetical protein